jgi:FkbM family methyltransferase
MPSWAIDTLIVAYWRARNAFPNTYEGEREHIQPFVARGDWVVDVGTNMGQYASRLALLVGPGGKVFGFEASTANFALTRRIVGKPPVELHNLAVGDQSKIVLIARYAGDSGMISHACSRVVPAADSTMVAAETVRCIRLDDILSDRQKAISLIKCDVEGYEVNVFRGAKDLIAQDRPVLLVEIEDPGNYREVMSILAPLDYLPYQLTAAGQWRRLGGFDNGWTNNFLFVPGSKAQLASR